ncbi:MAG: nucleoside-diphosphate kinase [Bacteroidota bacterium]
MKQRTLAIIKPDAVRKNYTGKIITMITDAGFKILGMKMTKISKEQAGAFYEIHKERPFYGELIEYMSNGSIVPIALEKENAIDDYRKLIGNTDPTLADAGSVRKLFGESKAVNAVHGSDSVENGNLEISFFFSRSDLVPNE